MTFHLDSGAGCHVVIFVPASGVLPGDNMRLQAQKIEVIPSITSTQNIAVTSFHIHSHKQKNDDQV